jgi:GNAT superfamily N-acetyltransferase
MKNRLPHIEMANESDASSIARINIISWQAAYNKIMPAEILDSLSVEHLTEGWKTQLQKNAIVLKISVNNEIIGFSFLCKHKLLQNCTLNQGEISAFYLDPRFWRQGFGKQLCLASLDKLRELGFKEASLWTLSDNYDAHRFYESLGFKKSGFSRCNTKFKLNETQYIQLL